MKKYYLKNQEYTEYLQMQEIASFEKYIHYLSKGKKKILDFGCGTGQVVNKLSKLNKDAYGVDISETSIKMARNMKGKFLVSSEDLPFKDNSFDSVGCFNVLEHLDNPEKCILEMIRVLKPDGIIVIACPNFLSVTSNYHPKVSGFKNKIINFLLILFKLLKSSFGLYEPYFEKMNPILDKPFKPDYDAINLTNPIDLKLFLEKNGIKIIYQSGRFHKKIIFSEMPFFRLFFGSVFIVGKK